MSERDHLADARSNEQLARRLLTSCVLGLHWARGHRNIIGWFWVVVLSCGLAVLLPAFLVTALIGIGFMITLTVVLYREDRRIRDLYGNPSKLHRTRVGFPTRAAISGAERQYVQARDLHGRAVDILDRIEGRS